MEHTLKKIVFNISLSLGFIRALTLNIFHKFSRNQTETRYYVNNSPNEKGFVSKGRIKISILSFDLSHNCLVRAYILAKMLSKKYEVEILGPNIEFDEVWKPLRNDPLIKYVLLPSGVDKIPKILRRINGDIIYAIKPKMTSYGYGLIKKLISKKPLVLDIDDWELGFFLDSKMYIAKSCLIFWDINNLIYTFLLEKLAKYADEITVSSSFLQKKFRGVIIPHARDAKLFNPKKYNREKLKKKLGIQNKKVIIFCGAIVKHKGIDDLIASINLLKDKNIVLILVGVDLNDSYTKSLWDQKKSNVKFIGQQPFEKIPEFLSASDLVVLPQKETRSAKGQVPAKVFDAMMMEKPIIATNVSDLPNILNGCGIIVESGDILGLASKIKYIFDNPDIAGRMGNAARKKCIREYSHEAVRPKLFKIFEKYEKNKIKNKEYKSVSKA